jgi:hypothetical protein
MPWFPGGPASAHPLDDRPNRCDDACGASGASMESTITGDLVAAVEEAFRVRSWHGTNLRGSVRGLTVAQASWRPRPDRHNIWELVVHAAYWKYAVRRRLTGEKRGSFPLEGSNFWSRPVEGTVAEWRRDVALLVDQHEQLVEAVCAFPARRWSQRAPGSPFTFAALVRGIAAHDLYHAGQVQLLKRLAGKGV